MDMHGTMDLKKQLVDGCSHISFHTMFREGKIWWYASGSVVDVDVDKLALYMHIQGTMHLKKQLVDGCSHSSVHTVFTYGDTWWYASGSVVDVDVDKLALCMDMHGTTAFKETIGRWMFTQVFTQLCSQMVTHGDMQVAV